MLLFWAIMCIKQLGLFHTIGRFFLYLPSGEGVLWHTKKMKSILWDYPSRFLWELWTWFLKIHQNAGACHYVWCLMWISFNFDLTFHLAKMKQRSSGSGAGLSNQGSWVRNHWIEGQPSHSSFRRRSVEYQELLGTEW